MWVSPEVGKRLLPIPLLKKYVIAISSRTFFSVTKTERIKQLTCSLLSCLTVSVATHFHKLQKLVELIPAKHMGDKGLFIVYPNLNHTLEKSSRGDLNVSRFWDYLQIVFRSLMVSSLTPVSSIKLASNVSSSTW